MVHILPTGHSALWCDADNLTTNNTNSRAIFMVSAGICTSNWQQWTMTEITSRLQCCHVMEAADITVFWKWPCLNDLPKPVAECEMTSHNRVGTGNTLPPHSSFMSMKQFYPPSNYLSKLQLCLETVLHIQCVQYMLPLWTGTVFGNSSTHLACATPVISLNWYCVWKCVVHLVCRLLELFPCSWPFCCIFFLIYCLLFKWLVHLFFTLINRITCKVRKM